MLSKPLFLVLLSAAGAAHAATYYKCTAPDGSLSYQWSSCPAGHESAVLERKASPNVPPRTEYGGYDYGPRYTGDDYSSEAEERYEAASRKIERENRESQCAYATRMYGVYGDGEDWSHLTRDQREDPNILYFKNEMARYCD